MKYMKDGFYKKSVLRTGEIPWVFEIKNGYVRTHYKNKDGTVFGNKKFVELDKILYEDEIELLEVVE